MPGMWRNTISVGGLLQAAAFLTVLFSWATLFAAAHRFLELFSHFRLQYLLASALLLIAFLVLRRRVEIVALAATLLLNAAQVVPWYGMPGAPDVASEATVTLLLANVYAKNDRYDDLLTLVDNVRPDVIVLQELTSAWLAHVGPALVDYPQRFTIPREDAFGIGIFSRTSLQSTEVIAVDPLGFPTIATTILVANRPLSLVTTHPMQPVGKPGHEARDDQLREVAALVNARHADVLIGDLNTSMWGAAYRRLEDATGLRNSRRGFGVLPSWPTFLPIAMIPLDHCLVSDRIEVVDTALGDDIGSDHRPLLVRLAWWTNRDDS